MAVKLNGLWDITIFSKNLNLKYRIGSRILSVFPYTGRLGLSLNEGKLLYQGPRYVAKLLDETLTEKVSFAIVNINHGDHNLLCRNRNWYGGARI